MTIVLIWTCWKLYCIIIFLRLMIVNTCKVFCPPIKMARSSARHFAVLFWMVLDCPCFAFSSSFVSWVGRFSMPCSDLLFSSHLHFTSLLVILWLSLYQGSFFWCFLQKKKKENYPKLSVCWPVVCYYIRVLHKYGQWFRHKEWLKSSTCCSENVCHYRLTQFIRVRF